MADLHFLTAVQLSEKIKSKKISCLEMLDLFLARIEKFNPSLNAIIYLDKKAARERAKEADEALAKGESWGALHGVPMTVKENFNIAGQPSTWGVPDLKNNIAKEDALSVKRMKAIGVNFFAACVSFRVTAKTQITGVSAETTYYIYRNYLGLLMKQPVYIFEI